MKISATQILAIGAVGIVGIVIVNAKKGVKGAAAAVGTAFNPTDQGNFVNRAVNNVGDILDDGGDNESFSLGSAFFDLVERLKGKQPFDPNAPAQGSKISPPAIFDTAKLTQSVAS